MIKYFKDLLNTLIKIELHLKKISETVQQSPKGYGSCINTKHWNS